jgi:NAD(P)-dependent dehydrogenase (short-subunit alcohol dehydrogenase family)
MPARCAGRSEAPRLGAVAPAVLVTGASTGIGRACALHLADRGSTVYAGVRKQTDADSLAAEARGDLRPVDLDVTDEEGIDRAVETITAGLDGRGLVGLVNNAGIALGGPLEYLPIETWRTQLEVNVIGQVAVTKAFMPLIRKATGRILFIGSSGGRVGTPMMGPYNASKFALEGIAEAFREELRPWGLKVVLIEPGAIKTNIWDKGREQADDLEQRLGPESMRRYGALYAKLRKLLDRQDRTGIKPERVAKVIERALFSANPRPRYLVGPDAKAIGALSRVLPDRAKDATFRRASGLNVPTQSD